NNTTKPLPEIKLMVDVTAPGLTFAGSLGFLKLNAADHGTHLSGELDVDLQDGPDADTKLRVPELSSAPQLIKTAKISGDTHLDLLTSVDFGSGVFPSLGANLVVDWQFKDVDLLTLNHLKNFGSPPSVEFRNVTLDLGSFMSKFLAPVLRTINDVLEPIRPILNALRTRVPLLS